MGKKGTSIFAWLLALGFVFTASPIVSAQVKGEKKASRSVRNAAPGSVEPLRVINGQMRGRVISGQCVSHSRPSGFSLVLTKAEIVGEQLQLIGVFRLGPDARAVQNVRARIAGTMAKAVDPWPGPSKDAPKAKPKANANEQQQGREAKNPEAAGQLGQLTQSTQDTARKTPPAQGERTEQTQPVYAQPEIGAGCGVLFLSMSLTQRLRSAMGASARPVQLGVVLAPLDNSLGEEINSNICAIVQISRDKSGDGRLLAGVDELNRLLASSR